MLPSSEGDLEHDATPEESQEVSNSSPDASTGELEEGSYVIVRFEGKKTPYHFVGKIVNKEEENCWNINYLRCCFDDSSPRCVSFKEPENLDFFITDSESIIKLLPKPTFVKQKLYFKKNDIGDLRMR
ncbi:hypothetical protein Pmani_008199 [Petrolisthes manimaculis]|uniref:Uncharacterized protein n=1 Tax=Petrolisthes manimaculis TaxID=1843537 RepID=A0AAE1UJV2_9EUCA|nr:hypothetical protein Pmani_008199 [Petrolisthes manimaculis]